MADDDKDTTKTTPTLEERVEALQAELAAERTARTKESEKAQVLERTLAALGGARQSATGSAASAPPLPPLSPEAITRLKARLGSDWTDNEVRHHYAIITPFFEEVGGPIVQQLSSVLFTLGDKLDYHDVELTDADFRKYRAEVKDEIDARKQRGEPAISRKEVTQIVKARHFADEVKTASEAALAAEKERLAAAGSATTEAGSTHKATPGAAAAGKITKPEDVDKIEKHADRVKAIEDQLGDTPIP